MSLSVESQPDHDWEQGPDALRYPGLYDIDDDPDNVDHDENAGNLDNVGRQPR